MPYSSKLPNDPKNPKKKRELAERAKREAQKQDSITAKDKRGKDTKLDPNAVEFFPAVCPDCGSLGNYLRQGDATSAEIQHQANRHSNTPGKPTLPVEAQNKRNRWGKK